MARVDVARMRRYAERNSEAQEAREYRTWLASLTPEHRAIHEGPSPICSTCINESMRRVGETFARMGKRHSHTWHMTSQAGVECKWECGGCSAHKTTFDGKVGA